MQESYSKKDLIVNWNLQLYKEYDHICYQYGIPLKKPLIVIEDINYIWGSWNKHLKKLVISLSLIENHTWDFVLGILKHEIAHQIVTDVFFSDDGHKGDFLKACELIQVPKEFCKAHVDLADKIYNLRNDKSPDDILQRKLEKLLSLATSANEYEAKLAMEKVHDLYKKYNISEIEQGVKSEYFSILVNLKKKKLQTQIINITSLLQEHFLFKLFT